MECEKIIEQIEHEAVKNTSNQEGVEQGLWQSDSLFRLLAESAPVGIVIADKSEKTIYLNRHFTDLSGYTVEDMPSVEQWWPLAYPDEIERENIRLLWSEAVKKASETHSEIEPVEHPVTCKNGEVKDIEFRLASKGEFNFVILTDITKRRQAEEALRKSEKHHRTTLDTMIEGCQIIGFDWRYIYINDAAEAHNQRPKEELLGNRYMDMWPGIEETEVFARIQYCMKERIAVKMENMFLFPDGSTGWFELVIHPVAEGVFILSMEITERKRAEARERHLTDVLRSIRNVNQLITQEKERDKLLTRACALLTESRGYSFAWICLIDSSDEIFSAGEPDIGAGLEIVCEQIRRGEWPACCDRALANSDIVVVQDLTVNCVECAMSNICQERVRMVGALRHAGRNYGVLVVALPTTMADDPEEQSLFREVVGDIGFALHSIEMEAEQERLRQHLAHAQKIESVGQLAGGIAHDYNNMLSVIIGYAELTMESVAPDEQLYNDLNQILRAAQRSSKITRQLLTFARKQTIAPEVLDLNECCTEILNVLKRLIGEDINLLWRPRQGGVWSVKMDPSQIDQLLTNLCVNARDAISGVGKITIETDNLSIDEIYCTDHFDFTPGDFVLLAVSDDGCGMDRATLDHIFEPFYTTKAVGKGTGMGLATVYGIVKQNNGFINVYSERGGGTAVKIFLPRYSGESEERCSDSGVANPQGNGETILLVEDEEAIMNMSRIMLEKLGYHVLAAATPGEAMMLASEHLHEIELLITDVVMPEMNGRDLANQLNTIYPGLKTLFMSGYTANVIAHRGVLDDGINFIQKPFSKNRLATMVYKALGSS